MERRQGAQARAWDIRGPSRGRARRIRDALSFLLISCLLLSSCALRPSGEDDERERIEQAGKPYEEPRESPELPADPGAMDYLRHAFLSSGELEVAYHQWRAALEKVPQDSSFPALAIPVSYMFSSGNMKAWDRTTLGVSNDPMTNIPFPTKLAAAGRRALEEARAAGLRFEAAKFALQEKVLDAFHDFALLGEEVRIQEESVAVLEMSVALGASRLASGAEGQEMLLRAQIQLELARNELGGLRAQVPGASARLSALIGRSPALPLPVPRSLPPARPLPASDAEMIRLGSERNPGLSALAREVKGREEALDLARQAYLPDFSLSFNFTGSVAQTVGGMIVLPTRLEAISAGIREARANLRAAEAAKAQYSRDLSASFVLELSTLRNDERQMALFEASILPRATQAVEAARTAYAAGRGGFQELLLAQAMLLEARLTLARVRTEREKALAALEALAAVDVEALDVKAPDPEAVAASPSGA